MSLTMQQEMILEAVAKSYQFYVTTPNWPNQRPTDLTAGGFFLDKLTNSPKEVKVILDAIGKACIKGEKEDPKNYQHAVLCSKLLGELSAHDTALRDNINKNLDEVGQKQFKQNPKELHSVMASQMIFKDVMNEDKKSPRPK